MPTLKLSLLAEFLPGSGMSSADVDEWAWLVPPLCDRATVDLLVDDAFLLCSIQDLPQRQHIPQFVSVSHLVIGLRKINL